MDPGRSYVPSDKTATLESADFLAVYRVGVLPSYTNHEKISAVYAIRNVATGNFYIGSSDHVIRRFCAHISQLRRGKHHSIRLQFAWQSRGEAAFEFIILESVPVDELIERERELVLCLVPEYNFAEPGENPMRGRTHTLESLMKMSEARKGKGRGPRNFSEAHRRALSAALKGKPRPGLRGRKPSDDTRKRMSEAAKKRGLIRPPRPVEIDGVRYDSGKAAAAALGISHFRMIQKIRKGMGRYLDEEGSVQTIPWSIGRLPGLAYYNARAVIVGELQFDTCQKAADHFGINQSTLNYWIARGRARYADGGPSTSKRAIVAPPRPTGDLFSS